MNIEILKYLARVKHASVSLATVLPPKSGSLGTSSICSACTPQLVNRTFHVLVIHIATYMNYDISSQALLFSFLKKERERKAIIWSGTQKIKWMHSANEPFQKPDQNINLSWLLQNQTVTVWFKNTPKDACAENFISSWLYHQNLIKPLGDEAYREEVESFRTSIKRDIEIWVPSYLFYFSVIRPTKHAQVTSVLNLWNSGFKYYLLLHWLSWALCLSSELLA